MLILSQLAVTTPESVLHALIKVANYPTGMDNTGTGMHLDQI